MSAPWPWADWKDDLHDASFRDVPFKVHSATTSVGRMNVLHQYPFRDEPYLEDLGMDGDQFSLEAYIVQNKRNDWNYMGERDALIDALKKEGAGKLIHPFRGEVTVGVFGKVRIVETFAEGGIARFTITFVYTVEAQFPETEIDPLAAVDSGVLGFLNDCLDAFGEAYAAVDDALDTAMDYLTMVTSAVNGVRGAIAATVSGALGYISSVVANVGSLLNAPCDLAADLLSAYDSFLSIGGLVGDMLTGGIIGGCSGVLRDETTLSATAASDAIPYELGASLIENMLTMLAFESSLPPIVGTAIDSRATRETMMNLAFAGAVGNASRILIRTEFDSVEDAEAALVLVTQGISNHLEWLGESRSYLYDNVFSSLSSLRETLISAMQQKMINLPKVIDYEVPSAVESTLTLAYDRYEDLNRADEIELRNRPLVSHPGFLPSGQEIELLNE